MKMLQKQSGRKNANRKMQSSASAKPICRVHSEGAFEDFETLTGYLNGMAGACPSSESGSDLFGTFIFAKIEQIKWGSLCQKVKEN